MQSGEDNNSLLSVFLCYVFVILCSIDPLAKKQRLKPDAVPSRNLPKRSADKYATLSLSLEKKKLERGCISLDASPANNDDNFEPHVEFGAESKSHKDSVGR